mmetsp:Transcript_62309/g.176969  ORF Transcript_62309/g.176969 Transcript_62309/m.176969 type:complete len:211 (+) Transcript_62309:580-1212(+)
MCRAAASAWRAASLTAPLAACVRRRTSCSSSRRSRSTASWAHASAVPVQPPALAGAGGVSARASRTGTAASASIAVPFSAVCARAVPSASICWMPAKACSRSLPVSAAAAAGAAADPTACCAPATAPRAAASEAPGIPARGAPLVNAVMGFRSSAASWDKAGSVCTGEEALSPAELGAAAGPAGPRSLPVARRLPPAAARCCSGLAANDR